MLKNFNVILTMIFKLFEQVMWLWTWTRRKVIFGNFIQWNLIIDCCPTLTNVRKNGDVRRDNAIFNFEALWQLLQNHLVNSSHESTSESCADPLQVSLKEFLQVTMNDISIDSLEKCLQQSLFPSSSKPRNCCSCHHKMFFINPHQNYVLLCRQPQESMQVERNDMLFQYSQDHSWQMFQVPNVKPFQESKNQPRY